MAMGFGCNAAGIVGCRIDSPRERLIAIITNNSYPAGFHAGAILTMFFVASTGVRGSVVSTLLLTCLIVLGGL